MKIEIKVAVNTTKVNCQMVQIETIETPKYYSMMDDGVFFPRGLVLFAIIPKYAYSYILISVERNKQDYDDFHPKEDCHDECWLKTGGVRKTAFMIMTNSIHSDFKEITKEDFFLKRNELLSDFANHHNI